MLGCLKNLRLNILSHGSPKMERTLMYCRKFWVTMHKSKFDKYAFALPLKFLALVPGTVFARPFLESQDLIPSRYRKKFNKVTSSMIESGLYRFYTSFADYKFKLRRRIHSSEDDENFQALTIQQLRRPMVLIFGLWTLSIVVFIAEHIFHKWQNWRSCRVKYFYLNQSYFGIIQSYCRRVRTNFRRNIFGSNVSI